MTTRIADAQNFLDINGLNSIRQDAKTGDSAGKKEALEQAAKQFEAIFMQMLMTVSYTHLTLPTICSV